MHITIHTEAQETSSPIKMHTHNVVKHTKSTLDTKSMLSVQHQLGGVLACPWIMSPQLPSVPLEIGELDQLSVCYLD